MAKKPNNAGRVDRGKSPRTLVIDVGGTGIKAMVLDARGRPLNDRVRVQTPKHATPSALVGVIRKLARRSGAFDRVSAGFPGVVKDGVVYTAANLGKGWKGFPLARELKRRLGRPARVANDADVQGLGCVTGRGIELVITLGTGFGSVLFADGHRIHLELAHHPFHAGKTYEDELGHRALAKKGKRKWNRLLREALDDLKQTFNYDRLYIGGGNTKYIKLKLPRQVTIISNLDGLLGGIGLWQDVQIPVAKSVHKRTVSTTPKQKPPQTAMPKASQAATPAPPPSRITPARSETSPRKNARGNVASIGPAAAPAA
jgi:polyphosphate glucokinase